MAADKRRLTPILCSAQAAPFMHSSPGCGAGNPHREWNCQGSYPIEEPCTFQKL
jgi:hypothetical protein